MDIDSISGKVEEINLDMARALEVLEEVSEHAELVRKMTKKTFHNTRWEAVAEAKERSLKRELDEVMRCFGNKKTPDPKRLLLVFQKLGLFTTIDY